MGAQTTRTWKVRRAVRQTNGLPLPVNSYRAASFLTGAPIPVSGLRRNELLDWSFVQSQVDIVPDLVGLGVCHRPG